MSVLSISICRQELCILSYPRNYRPVSGRSAHSDRPGFLYDLSMSLLQSLLKIGGAIRYGPGDCLRGTVHIGYYLVVRSTWVDTD